MHHHRIATHPGVRRGSAGSRWSLLALTIVIASCASRGPSPASRRPAIYRPLALVVAGVEHRGASASANRLGDTPASTDEQSRLAAQMAAEHGVAHINDVARRVRYNSGYFEIHIEINRQPGIVPVTWEMLRAHTPVTSESYYARVYTTRDWAGGWQASGLGPAVILPEAFTPELTPVIFAYLQQEFVNWNRSVNGQGTNAPARNAHRWHQP